MTLATVLLDRPAATPDRRIRALLVVSARDEVTDRAAAFDAGCDAFLAKPFGLAELLSRVTELAGRSPPTLSR